MRANVLIRLTVYLRLDRNEFFCPTVTFSSLHVRKRQERLFLIQAQILHRLGITGRTTNTTNPNTFSDEERQLISRVVQRVPSRTIINGVNGVNEIASSEIFAERLQSFYPSCNAPNHTDQNLWKNSRDADMRLFFDITFPKSSESQTELSVVSAKVRLYKINDPVVSPPSTPVSNYVLSNIYQYSSQQGILLSLYQYMRPLRLNRRGKTC